MDIRFPPEPTGVPQDIVRQADGLYIVCRGGPYVAALVAAKRGQTRRSGTTEAHARVGAGMGKNPGHSQTSPRRWLRYLVAAILGYGS